MNFSVYSRRILIVCVTGLAAAAYFFIGGTGQSAQERVISQRRSRFEKFRTSDAVTADIRNKSRELTRIEIETPSDRSKVERFGRIVEDFGSFVVLSKSQTTDLGNSGLRSKKLDSNVHLPSGDFDPLLNPPDTSVVAGSTAGLDESGYYVIQFGGLATDEWLDSLRDIDVEILQYLPDQAFLVYGDRASIAKAAGHSRIRWTGRFSARNKVPEILRKQLDAAKDGRSITENIPEIEKTSDGTAVFDVAVFSRADVAVAAQNIEQISGARIRNISRLPNNFFNVVRAEVPLDRVESIASIPDVARIDAWQRPVKEDERSAQIVAGNYSSATSIAGPGYNPLLQFGVSGQGVTVSVVDDGVSIPGNGGFYLTASNAVNGPLRGAPAGASGGHGHLNASIIAGSAPFGLLDPLGYNYGLGIAPAANIINIPLLLETYSGTEADAYNDTAVTSAPNGVKGFISNNSWGNGLNANAYDTYTAQFDGFVRDASYASTIDPLLLVFSAGNNGPNDLSLTRPKAAKNLISVGNSENVRTEFGGTNADNIDDLRATSSRGPTADGRIKPDIIAPGTYITGSRAGLNCNSVSSCFDANHSYSTGTSHAAPQVAGAAALFTQFWRDANSGQNPSPALVKAAIINTGQEMNGANTDSASLPNGTEGWGRINLKYMLSTGVPMKYVNETVSLSNVGESYSLTGSVGDSSRPMRISLVWTDPPAAADPALVNNLNLTVTVNGNTYRGNVFAGGVSAAGGANDTVNNVENVWLPAGLAPGTPVLVQVTAAALNGDGILGNSDLTDQNFALVAYNVGEAAQAGNAAMDFDGDRKTDISVFRPSPQSWWITRSSDGGVAASAFGSGSAADLPVPADYTGDGKTDIAVWRGSDGSWYVLRSDDNTYYALPFGTSGDVPAPSDFDRDGKADITVFRPSTGTWFILQSSGGVSFRVFGTNGDRPVVGDYDGDGTADIAIYRPSAGEWWISKSSGGVTAFQFGASGDRAVPGDYTGDGRTDAALWRPSSGTWFVLRSDNAGYYSLPFGTAGDLPVPGDYDGDGKTDTAIFRPATATWFVNRSTAGIFITNFGLAGDSPLPNVFVR